MDRKAVDLLLSIMEMPKATIAGAVLSDYYGKQAGPLIAANLLERRGHELATTSMADHDDAPVSLTWSAEHNGYGYFSASAGWVTVPGERLANIRRAVPHPAGADGGSARRRFTRQARRSWSLNCSGKSAMLVLAVVHIAFRSGSLVDFTSAPFGSN